MKKQRPCQAFVFLLEGVAELSKFFPFLFLMIEKAAIKLATAKPPPNKTIPPTPSPTPPVKRRCCDLFLFPREVLFISTIIFIFFNSWWQSVKCRRSFVRNETVLSFIKRREVRGDWAEAKSEVSNLEFEADVYLTTDSVIIRVSYVHILMMMALLQVHICYYPIKGNSLTKSPIIKFKEER